MQHNTQAIRVVIGLGNPDPSLSNTYHNAGTLALPGLAAVLAPDAPQPLAFKPYKKIFESAEADGIVFVRPLVYMNESGRAVKEAMKVFKAAPGEIAVVHDDSDLEVGKFKIADGGGAAGHKGILSTVAHLGTEQFTRVRIGIREPNEIRRKKAGDFVLSPVSAGDMEKLSAAFDAIARELKKRIHASA